MRKNLSDTRDALTTLLSHLIENRIPSGFHYFAKKTIPSDWIISNTHPRLIINLSSVTEINITSEDSNTKLDLLENHAVFLDVYFTEEISKPDSLLIITIDQSGLSLNHLRSNDKTSIDIDFNIISDEVGKSFIDHFQGIMECNSGNNPFIDAEACSLTSLFLISILKALKSYDLRRTSDKSVKKTSNILAYLAHNFRNADLNRKSAAAALNISASYLNKLLTNQTGLGFIQHILLGRLELARKQLVIPDMGIPDIAKTCGFNSHAHFTYSFSKKYNISPISLRKILRSKKIRTADDLRKIHYTEGYEFAEDIGPVIINGTESAPPQTPGAGVIIFCNETNKELYAEKVGRKDSKDRALTLEPGQRCIYVGPNFIRFQVTDDKLGHKAAYYLKDRNLIAIISDIKTNT